MNVVKIRRLSATGLAICIAVFFFWISAASANTLTLGAGAGYKRMLENVLNGYERATGQKVNQVYGHMGQIVMQTKAAGNIGIIVGELSFLKSSGIEFADFQKLGYGVLVLAYSKNVTLKSANDLNRSEIQKIAIPDTRQAIYGKAAFEFLKNSGLYPKIKNKIITVATVPQVSSYLMSQDVEAGFINITDAIYIKDKIGGWIMVDKARYNPIQLVIAIVKGYENDPATQHFLNFMKTDRDTQKILREAGIE
jgi:molybdate transport system substrate-binding protein